LKKSDFIAVAGDSLSKVAWYINHFILSGQLACQFPWQGALRREWSVPSQETQHRHGVCQANPSGASVAFRPGVIALAKGTNYHCLRAMP